MALTLQAFYYLAIQLYVVTEVYTSLYKISLLRKLYDCLDGNMEESNLAIFGCVSLEEWICIKIEYFREIYSSWNVLPRCRSNLFENQLVLFNIWFHNLLNSGDSSCYRYTWPIFHHERNDRRSVDSPILLWVSTIPIIQYFCNQIQSHTFSFLLVELLSGSITFARTRLWLLCRPLAFMLSDLGNCSF